MKTTVLILENIRSVENTASIFRTAEGLGVSKIFLIGTTPAPLDRFGRKRQDFAKVALGSEEYVEWEYYKDTQEVVEKLRPQGYQLVALEQAPHSISLTAFHSQEHLALIVGNEVDGVSTHTLELADAVVEIPMHGKKESLNVAVATGIALFVIS